MARKASPQSPRTLGWILQERLRQTEPDVAGIGRHGAELRLDRWHSQAHRWQKIRDQVYSAETRQHMEHRKRQTREGTHTSGTDAPCGAESVPGAQEEWSVLLRAKDYGQTWRLVRGTVPRQQASLALLPGPSALVPEDRHLVGHQHEEGRDQAQAVGRAHQRLGARANSTAVDAPGQRAVGGLCHSSVPGTGEFLLAPWADRVILR